MASVYDRLRSDIVLGELRPGKRLRFEELKESYGVGLSPLREALTRLASENPVQLEQHKGFRVSPVSRKDLADLLFMRQQIESMGIRLALQNGDDEWEASIVAAIHALRKSAPFTPEGQVDGEWERRHRTFHDALVAAAGSPRLLLYRTQLLDHFDRYRILFLQTEQDYTDAGRDPLAEHVTLADTALARDVDGMDELMRQHLGRTVDIIVKLGDSRDTTFWDQGDWAAP